MSSPLPDAFTVILRSDATSALAALLVIAGAHRDLFTWASKAICGAESSLKPSCVGNGVKPPSVHKRGDGVASYRKQRRTTRDELDAKLLEEMRANPGASIGELSTTIDRSKTTTVAALHRLKDAGLVENRDRSWRLVEEPAPREPPPPWVKPPSAVREHAHA